MLTIEAKGKSNVISTSKIKKITAIKKNRSEKGKRAVPLGSNPHSNGEFFSRSDNVFFDNKEAIIITTVEIIRIIVVAINNIIIVFSKGALDLLIGSQLYSYTKKTTSSPIDSNI